MKEKAFGGFCFCDLWREREREAGFACVGGGGGGGAAYKFQTRFSFKGGGGGGTSEDPFKVDFFLLVIPLKKVGHAFFWHFIFFSDLFLYDCFLGGQRIITYTHLAAGTVEKEEGGEEATSYTATATLAIAAANPPYFALPPSLHAVFSFLHHLQSRPPPPCTDPPPPPPPFTCPVRCLGAPTPPPPSQTSALLLQSPFPFSY